MTRKRKICIITGTRAEWGLLSGVARELQRREDVELQIVATNMHLEPRYGHSIDEIEADGFRVDARVAMPAAAADTPAAKVKAMGECMAGMADAFSALAPDLAVILGDRYEMLAVASAAALMSIPVAHLHGGELTFGAVDDSIRHAITKLSALHLTSTEAYRQRVIQMGEDPERVINTGAIGVYNAMNEPTMSAEELSRSVNLSIDRRTILLTYHPATLDPVDPTLRFAEVLRAIDAIDNVNVLITYPNNDARGLPLIDMINDYAAARPCRVAVVPSLGKRRYLSAIRYVGVVAGNSSSGLIEVPSAHTPTVDIGIRQKGRLAAPSVLHCGDSASEIEAALRLALDPATIQAALAENPYYRPDTLKLIVDALVNTPLSILIPKHFHETTSTPLPSPTK